MDYIQKIFKRAKVKNVVDHLLYGYEPDTEITDYESRMDEAFEEYGKVAQKYGPGGISDLMDAATELTEVIPAVYMEIGFQCGLLFMQEIYHNSERGSLSERKAKSREQKKEHNEKMSEKSCCCRCPDSRQVLMQSLKQTRFRYMM